LLGVLFCLHSYAPLYAICAGAGAAALLQVLLSATEAAEMILRVDDIIRCAPRQRSG
jgi:hypothetical protein